MDKSQKPPGRDAEWDYSKPESKAKPVKFKDFVKSAQKTLQKGADKK